MKTSDKELDDLFASKLDGFEVEPSANLWQNIASELDGKPKKKTIIPALRIAAGIVVILSVGLLFLRKQEQINNQLPKKIAKVELQKEDPSKKQIKNLGDKNSMLLLSAKNKTVKTVSAENSIKAHTTRTFPATKPAIKATLTQTLAQVKPNLQAEIAQNNPSQTQITLVPDASVSLKPQPEIESPIQTILKPQVLAVTNLVKTKHKRIRSIGDVVNLVMAKVDKREDKLIEFTNRDGGDEAELTGINLGFISLKKEK